MAVGVEDLIILAGAVQVAVPMHGVIFAEDAAQGGRHVAAGEDLLQLCEQIRPMLRQIAPKKAPRALEK